MPWSRAPSTTRRQAILTRGELNSTFQQASVLSERHLKLTHALALPIHDLVGHPVNRARLRARGELVHHGLVVTGRSSDAVGAE